MDKEHYCTLTANAGNIINREDLMDSEVRRVGSLSLLGLLFFYSS
jgi:hypothetical protein